MKKSKLKLVAKILAVVIICLISFAGIYVQKLNKMENVVKDYELGKDLKGYRQIVFEVSDDTDEDTGESVNADENKTVENYELAKSIIEKRLSQISKLSVYEDLKDVDVGDYNISLDKQTGKIYVQIPETVATDSVVSILQETAVFEMKDSEDGTVYLSNDDIKSASSVYQTTDSGTIVYLEIEFNKEGASTLEDISGNKYATIDTTSDDTTTTDNTTSDGVTAEVTTSDDSSDETSENATSTDESESADTESTDTEDATSDDESTDETEETETQKEITLSISGEDIVTTSFDTVITGGKMDLSMNSATSDTDEINGYLQSAATIALLLNNGALPLEYEITENQYVETDLSLDVVRNVLIVVGVLFVILLVYMIIKNKLRGLLAGLSFIGFVGLYLLLIRYTNVVITLESIVSGIIVLFINYVFSLKLLNINSEKKNIYNKEYLQEAIKLIPAYAISIVFTMTKWTVLNSFGMMMFWGISLILLYNILITKNIVD